MACLCWEVRQSCACSEWQPAQVSLPTKVAADTSGELAVHPPPRTRRNPRPIARTMSNAAAAAIAIVRFRKPDAVLVDEMSCGAWVCSGWVCGGWACGAAELVRDPLFPEDFGRLRVMFLVAPGPNGHEARMAAASQFAAAPPKLDSKSLQARQHELHSHGG